MIGTRLRLDRAGITIRDTSQLSSDTDKGKNYKGNSRNKNRDMA